MQQPKSASTRQMPVTLSKSSQKTSHQKRLREAELLRTERKKEREEPLQLPRWSGGPGDAAKKKLRTLEHILPPFQHHVAGGVKSAGHLREPEPQSTGLPLIQAKDVDRLTKPRLLSDDDWKDRDGKMPVTLSKSLQKKIQQKRMELLHTEREREKGESLQLPLQSGRPEGAAKESFHLPPINEAVSISASTRNAPRVRACDALRKQVNKPLLPSIPITSQGGSFLHNSSANSLPAIAVDCPKEEEKPEQGVTPKSSPFLHPEQELLDALTCLSSDNWQQRVRGFFIIRCLTAFHLEVILCRLHDVSLAVSKEVNNLHLKVAQLAMSTLTELCRTLKKHMDHEVNEIARVLLQKTVHSHEFVQKAANQSLGVVVGSVSPVRAMSALIASGVRHHNVLVRKCAAKHLATIMERTGAKQLLSGKSVTVELLVRTVVKLAQDCHPDTRCYGRKMLSMLMNHQKCHRYLKQFVSPHDLQDIMRRVKQMGREEPKCEPPSAKDPNLVMPQDSSRSDGGLRSGSAVLTLPRQTVCHMSLQTVGETEQLNELYKLLTAKEFQTRMEGLLLLLDFCKSSPQLISTNIVQIFKVFALRLQDCNKKVKEKALEVLTLMMPMLRGALHPVLDSLVAAVTENLNSKHTEVYTTAVKVLEASIAHLDNSLLLKAFAQQLHCLSDQALLIVTEHFSGCASAHLHV